MISLFPMKALLPRLPTLARFSASGNNIGIFNSGIITTLNNSQGASGSALTYDGTLPTNYNIIVNSTSDFGKIVFTDVSGTINFGIDSSSTLANDTTYSSVLSGLISSDIASGISGTFVPSNARSDVSGTTITISANCADLDISGTYSNVTINSGVTISGKGDKNWSLNNSSGTLWDLVVSDSDHDDVVNTGTGTVINNSGTISAGDDNGLLNEASASITTLTNLGPIYLDSLAAKLRCIPRADHAAKFLLNTFCCCCCCCCWAGGDVGKPSGLSIISTGRSPQ